MRYSMVAAAFLIVCSVRVQALREAGVPPTPGHVTLSRAASPITPLLEELSEQSGVSLRVDKDLAALRVTVRLEGVPISHVRECLSTVLHLSWKRDERVEKGKEGYVLYRSARDAAEATRLRELGEKAARNGIEEMIRALKLSPEEFEKLKESRPLIHALLSLPVNREAAGMAAHLSPEQMDRLCSGGQLTFLVADLPATLRQLAAQCYKRQDLPDQLAREPSTVVFRTRGTGVDRTLDVGLYGPNGARGAGIRGTGYEEAYANEPPAVPLPADDPSIDEIVTLREPLKADKFDEFLVLLADALDFDLVSEAYTQSRWLPTYSYEPHKQRRRILLDTLCTGLRVWGKKGKTYLIQHVKWYEDRLAEVPEDVVKYYKENWRKEYSLELVTSLGRLRPEQWPTLEGQGGPAIQQMLPQYPLFSFFAHLSPAQQRLLFSDQGLSGAGLRGEDLRRFEKWLEAADGTGSGIMPPAASTHVFARVDSMGTRFVVAVPDKERGLRTACEELIGVLPRAAKPAHSK
jgi:hypothetical protein